MLLARQPDGWTGKTSKHCALWSVKHYGCCLVSKLLIANDTGSKDLIVPLQRMGVPAEPANLDFGDVVFMGRGERGEKLWVGIEFKTIAEFAGAMTTKRLQGHQILGMVDEEAGFDRRYLLLEGDFHHNDAGQAVTFAGKKPRPLHGAPNAIAFEQEMINIAVRCGFWVERKTTRRDSLRWIVACYRYWTDKDLDQHKSHLAMYAPDLDKGLLNPPSDFRKALNVMLPNIGFAVSKAVEQHVGEKQTLRVQLQRMAAMTAEQWAGLETLHYNRTKRTVEKRQFGSKRARTVMEALDGK
jgi:hypothetical protein